MKHPKWQMGTNLRNGGSIQLFDSISPFFGVDLSVLTFFWCRFFTRECLLKPLILPLDYFSILLVFDALQ